MALDLEPLESRRLLATFTVTNTLDNGSNTSPTPGSLRAAIVAANQAAPGPNSIHFAIPASTAPNLDVPVAGFDAINQTWTITPDGPLPTITTPVDIDGFTEANVGMPYAYPDEIASSSPPTEITTPPNSTAAIDGNNARDRVIVDGSASAGGTGFVLDASHSMLRGLIIDGFGVGVEVPNASDVGDAIQGDFIGSYLLYPVDPNSGTALPAPDGEVLVTAGSAQQGVVINGANTTLGGASPQDDVVITGSGSQGVWIQSGALGTQVLGCQIGVIGPSDFGVYYSVGNGAEGVLVQSSSDLIGATGAGNVISADTGDGVQLDQGATQVQVAGNFIGVPPGGVYKFGNGIPGNGGDGVDIIGAANNTVGGTSSGAGNAISSNAGDGVDISGATATGNIVSFNLIGVTSDGSQALGNADDGVAVSSSRTQIGPGNVISANGIGVDITGATTTGIDVIGNLIGTDGTGEFGLGNEFQGVLVDAASGVTIQGDAAGSQVISGNEIGIELTDSATAVLIEGTFIGTDKTGSIALPNAHQGILIDQGAWDNTIGGTATTSKNVISTNHWGVEIDGGPPSGPSANALMGNLIGTDITGQLPLGNEIDGVTITDSSGNTIGGIASVAGNTIAFNTDAGVHVVSGNADAIESNSIFSNGTLGIQLDGSSNDGIVAPALSAALPDTALISTEIDISYVGLPNSAYLIQFFSTPGAVAQGRVEGETYIGATSLRTDATGAIIGAPERHLRVRRRHGRGRRRLGDGHRHISGFDPRRPCLECRRYVRVLQPAGRGDQPLPGHVHGRPGGRVHSRGTALGTLRFAIDFSNNHPSPSASAPNDVRFRIAGVGLQTIALQQALPAITAPLIIDGYSQAGSRVNDSSQFVAPDTFDDQETDIATILVQLDGSRVSGAEAIGLDVQAPGCTIDGLSLTGFSGAAIFLEPGSSAVAGAVGDTVWGNFIGVNQFNPHTYNPVKPSTNSFANGVGVLIDEPEQPAGGTSTADRNVIQGNRGDGVIMYGSAGTGNTIATDFILDNGGDGVLLLSASNHVGQISGQGLAGAGDLISGNRGNGVHILDPMARGNTVANNEIGTQVGLAGLAESILGMQVRPNLLSGVLIENAPANTVGGLVGDSANVLSGNTLDGITIENYVNGAIPSIVSAPPANTPYASGTGNVVEGNLIGYNSRNGVDATLPNQEDGINISSAGNVVGGDVPAAQNQIVANRRNGITIAGIPLDAFDNPDSSGDIPFSQPVANVVEGNFIGTVSGSDDYGNTFDGILIDQAGGNTLGATALGASNVVSNNAEGIVIAGPLSTGNLVAGNLIGTTADGTAPMGNAKRRRGDRGCVGQRHRRHHRRAPPTSSRATPTGSTSADQRHRQPHRGRLHRHQRERRQRARQFPRRRRHRRQRLEQHDRRHGRRRGQHHRLQRRRGRARVLRRRQHHPLRLDVVERRDGHRAGRLRQRRAGRPDDHFGHSPDHRDPGLGHSPVVGVDDVPDPALQQHDGRRRGQLRRAGADRLDHDHHRLRRAGQLRVDPAGEHPFRRRDHRHRDQPDHGRHLGVLGERAQCTADLLQRDPVLRERAGGLGRDHDHAEHRRRQLDGRLLRGARHGDRGRRLHARNRRPDVRAGPDERDVQRAGHRDPGSSRELHRRPGLEPSHGRRPGLAADRHPRDHVLAGDLAVHHDGRPRSRSRAARRRSRSIGSAALPGRSSVSYATAAVNAIAGVDYVAVSGTLTFPPGATQESFTLPILGNSSNPDDATIAVSLSGVNGGASLGSPTTETVTIDKPLIITGEQVSAGRGGITSITLTFNKPLDPTQAVNLANFGYFVYWANPSGIFAGGGSTTPLSAAVYNAANLSLTLIPAAAVAAQPSLSPHRRRQRSPRAGQRAGRRVRRAARRLQRRAGDAVLGDLRRRQAADL